MARSIGPVEAGTVRLGALLVPSAAMVLTVKLLEACGDVKGRHGGARRQVNDGAGICRRRSGHGHNNRVSAPAILFAL
jgi:hypothetical protein